MAAIFSRPPSAREAQRRHNEGPPKEPCGNPAGSGQEASAQTADE